MIFLKSISEIADNFDAFIVDLWGVVHDGQKLYPGVKETLRNLRAKNKEIIFLSNAPRRKSKVEAVLHDMGIGPEYYDDVVTSGEAAFADLQKQRPKKYYYIGPERDSGILENSAHARVESPVEADFAIVTGFDSDDSVLAEKMPELGECFAAKLPLVCTNPDKEIVRLDGKHALCSGVMAAAYEKMGGEVIYFGKPHRQVYDRCFEIFKTKDKARIAAIGDNLETDIKGANAAQIYSVFVTGGVMARELADGRLEDICKKYAAFPMACIAALK